MNAKTSNSKRPMKVHECIRQGSGMHPKYHRPYPSATISCLTLYADRDRVRITANDFVELKVQQSILRLGPQFTSQVGGVGNTVDSFFTRRLETTVLIPSGNTLVMGGLVSDENTTANTKVPVLGDIPLLGLAFRKDTKERNRQNLIVFITPTIVQDAGDASALYVLMPMRV